MAALLIIGSPLAAIYSTLARIGWVSSKGKMSDALVIWIVWLLSGVTACLPIAIIDIEARFLSGGEYALLVPIFTALVASSVATFFLMKRLSHSVDEATKINISLLGGRLRNVDFRAALLVSGAAAIALAVAVGVVLLAHAVYTYLYPPMQFRFNISY